MRQFTHNRVHLRLFRFRNRAGLHCADRDLIRVPVTDRRADHAESRETEQPNGIPRAGTDQAADKQQKTKHAADEEGRFQAVERGLHAITFDRCCFK